MRTRRSVVTSIVLSLVVGIAGMLTWGDTPALAASTSVLVPISGTVTTSTESVALTGLARISSTMVKDPDFTSPPGVVLTIDVLATAGKGLTTKQLYGSMGTDQIRRTRVLVPTDKVEAGFPFYRATLTGSTLIGSANVIFTINFDTKTGQIVQATGSIGNPPPAQ